MKRVFLAGLGLALASLGAQAEEVNELSRTFAGPWEKEIGYAQTVQAGRHLYLAGLVGPGETVETQLSNIYERIVQILSTHGADTSHIVNEVIYTTDMAALQEAISTRKAFFTLDRYPAATWVEVSRLFEPGLKVEVQVTVYLPE